MKFLKRTALLFVVVLLLIVWSIAENIWVGSKLREDANTMARLEKVAASARPLIQALESYQRDHDFYPVELTALNGEYLHLPSLSQTVWWDFLYSAEPRDYVFKSPECEAKQAQFHGWLMKPADELAKAKAKFVMDCVTGYREISLQSGDFPRDPQEILPDVDRWAYFTSRSGSWALGWCYYNSNMNREGVNHGQMVESNGKCRRL